MRAALRFFARWTACVALWCPLAAAASRALPPEVEAELARAKVPREAMVALVQEVGARRSRLAWHAERPVNPA